MMSSLRCIVLAGWSVLLSSCTAAPLEPNPQDFVSIFNGKDLSGWEGKEGWWTVEEGAITAESTLKKPCQRHNYLMWRGGEPADFELRLDYRIVGGNSGIQFRSRELPNWDTRGYQADLEAGPQWSGALFEHERGGIAMRGQKVTIAADGKKQVTQFADSALLEKQIHKNDWNSYRIVARGAEIRLFINGTLMSHAIDHQTGKAARKGRLALQMHPGPPMKVQFRNLRLKELPAGSASKTRSATRATGSERLKIAEGFKIDLIYSPDKKTEGSWVAMCVDPLGRLIVGNQYDEGLFRITLPSVDTSLAEVKVEKIDVDLSGTQGLVWFGESLYGLVTKNGKTPSGLYRVRDTDGDDRLDKVELLQSLEGGGDHGWHGIVAGPRNESLYLVGGNNARAPRGIASRVPRLWSEDHLLPRMPDARGHMKGLLAPGGAVYRVEPDGRKWELITTGFRNPYDIAFNREGELFAYDADMEWDMNTPWYRPTRVCHVVSGGEYGWRNGSGKWPTYYPDSLPPVMNTGPGSPTGITFGYGAAFPRRYGDALFLSDWSYGRVYAAHLSPEGASYGGESELFVSGIPFPVTDMVVNGKDGAMYIVTGGWRIQGGLYRITHLGNGKGAVGTESSGGTRLRTIRHELEKLHGRRDGAAVDAAWPKLGHPDRFIRFAARVALEWQDPEGWRERALAEKNPPAALTALLGLVRVSGRDRFHRRKGEPKTARALQARLLGALDRLDWNSLSDGQRLELVRVCGLCLIRLGEPGPGMRERLLDRFDSRFPAGTRPLNSELCQLLVYLESPNVAREAMKLISLVPTQEEQTDYAKSLRVLKTGWTPELRKAYFAWFQRAAGYRGGASFRGYIKMIKNDAVASLTEQERVAMGPLLEDPPPNTPLQVPSSVLAGRSQAREWTVAELAPALEGGLKGRNIERGRQMFGATRCFTCHRFAGEGGAMGPDLTGVGRRFSPSDLLESIIEPSRTVSDLYANTIMTTSDDEVIAGRIVYLGTTTVQVNVDMSNPGETIKLERKNIVSMKSSEVSPMPRGLLDRLEKDEILDLMAYVLSGER
ncbi:MAG: heme-binding protein [Planctomycetes bacterium]|nr:heme-binding protein [Planctomycetota bacterium]